MNTSIGDLNYMSDPKTTLFTFETVSGSSGETRIDRRDVDGVKRPVIVIGHLGRDASKVHEVRHGAEIATHKIRTVLGLIDGNDEEKAEVSAYRAQFSFDPSSMPSSKGGTPRQVGQVNGYYVGGIMNINGEPVYQRTNKEYIYK